MGDMNYGTEKITTTLDDQGSTLTVINKIHGGNVSKTYKQFCIRVKVMDAKEEMSEYLKHAEAIRAKKAAGTLLIKDDDPTLLPTFKVEYPKFNEDGSYFIVRTHTEYTEL